VRKEYTLQVNGKKHTLGQRTWIMGVINVTPDSFSDGGLYFDKDRAVEKGIELQAEGADIIDVGGESTKPGSEPIAAEEELRRIIPVISALRKRTSSLISVDTTKSEVAQAALDEGADIINDISSFRFDSKMLPLAAQKQVPVVLMHMKGVPKTMQDNPRYEDVVLEIKAFFKEKIQAAEEHGVNKEKIIIDPGIGFGKGLKDNLVLINRLQTFEELGCPILVGVSRKSFIGKILNLPAAERLEGTIASALLSIINGAHILRVHDVAAVRRAVLVAEAILNEDQAIDPLEEDREKRNPHVL
jgi:dihydropteroate synthase